MTVANIPAFSEPVTVVEGVDTYTFDYNVELATEVQVQVTDNGVVSYLTYGDDYTVVKADAPAVGGTITVTAELTVGAEVVSFRQTGLAQDTSLPNQGPYFAKTVEEALDRITMLAQEAARDSALALQYPVGSTAITLFPAPVENKAVVGRMVSGALQYVADGPSLDELNTSVSAAAASAAAASTSEGNAADSEEAAGTSATNAATSASAAADSAEAAQAASAIAQTIAEADGALMDYELADETAIKTLQAPDNTTISEFGASLVDDADAATARETLGLAEFVGPNLLRNPGFTQDTRGNAAGVTVSGSHVVDGWTFGHNTDVTTLTFSRIDDGGVGGEHAIRCTVTTGSDTSIGAGQYANITTAVEGKYFKKAQFGTANAQDVVASFWVRSTQTGVFCAALRNEDVDRSYVVEFTIDVANTWQLIVIIIPGDTSGTWENDTGVGCYLSIALAMGSTYQAGAADTWSAGNYCSTAAQSNLLDTNGNWLEITKPMLSVGGPIAWNPRQPHDEFQYCRRYARLIGTVPVSLISTTEAYIYVDTDGMREPSTAVLLNGASAIHHPLVMYLDITAITAIAHGRVAVTTSTSAGGRALAETDYSRILLTSELL